MRYELLKVTVTPVESYYKKVVSRNVMSRDDFAIHRCSVNFQKIITWS